MLVWARERLDAVSDARDKLGSLPHLLDEVLGADTLSWAAKNILAASFKALPKRGPIAGKPLQSEETKSFPARAVRFVLRAPLTAGLWSAVTLKIISTNIVHARGSRLRNRY